MQNPVIDSQIEEEEVWLLTQRLGLDETNEADLAISKSYNSI